MMKKLKSFVNNHFELSLIFMMVMAIEVIIFYTNSRLPFLNFFYLPVLLAGYYLGKKSAIETSLAGIFLTIFFLLLFPSPIFHPGAALSFNTVFDVLVWAGFLLLAAILVGTLYDEKEKHVETVKLAYIGILEILSKYLESYDRYTQGHSVRVAKLATETAIAMRLPRNEVENIKAAALLHDIGKVDVSLDLIKKSARLSQEEKKLVDQHSQKGANLLRLVGNVLDDAIPLVVAHHKSYYQSQSAGENFPIGARIISVADAYDALVTDRPYHKAMLPWQALNEIEKEKGDKFDPAVVDAFQMVLTEILNEDEARLEAAGV